MWSDGHYDQAGGAGKFYWRLPGPVGPQAAGQSGPVERWSWIGLATRRDIRMASDGAQGWIGGTQGRDQPRQGFILSVGIRRVIGPSSSMPMEKSLQRSRPSNEESPACQARRWKGTYWVTEPSLRISR